MSADPISRTGECDESDGDSPCWYHDPDPCPSCECGYDETKALVEQARQALRAAP